MRSAYALIPAALLAGTVVSASAEAKSSRVEDPAAHTQLWNAKQKYFKSRAKIMSAKKRYSFAKAQSRKPWDGASAKPRQLADQTKYKMARVTPVTEIALNAPAKEAIVAPKGADAALKVASIAWMSMTKTLRSGPRQILKPARVTPVTEIARIAPAKEAIVAPKEADAALKMASIASRPMTKTLRSGPREIGRPFVLARLPVPNLASSRMKPPIPPMFSTSFEGSRLLMASPHGLHCALPASNPALILMLADVPARSASTNLSAIRRGSWASWANVMS